MRTALFTPFSKGPQRGNIITTGRIARNLPSVGWKATIFPLDQFDEGMVLESLLAKPPDIIHAFHAFHSGPAASRLASALSIPLVVTMTGSDLFDPAFRNHPATLDALLHASAVTCFDPLTEDFFRKTFEPAALKSVVVPQGVETPEDVELWPRPPGSFIILLPAALRPAKGILEAIEQLGPLASELPQLRLWIVGGILDCNYAEQVRAISEKALWVEMKGEVSHHLMGGVYRSCDIVLNSSIFEGGMANSLMEAMAAGKPVIASDITGNRSLVADGSTGWLYKSGEELRELVRKVVAGANEFRDVADRTASEIRIRFSAVAEAESISRLYASILARS